jgi:hypothetical protein
MVGFPKQLKTKTDWLNAVAYAKETGEGKTELVSSLLELKNHTMVLMLKAASKNKPAEEQTPEDYEPKPDPACEKILLGFSDSEIDELIGGLQ